MTAWLIVDTQISDADAYETYKARARPIAEKHGGEYVARGGRLDVVESDLWTPTRLVVIRFRTWPRPGPSSTIRTTRRSRRSATARRRRRSPSSRASERQSPVNQRV